MPIKLIISVLALAAYLISSSVFAKCSKEDIEFYLEKGFNQEQITQLCATSEGASVPDYKPYQQQVVIYRDAEAPGIKGGFTREEREAIKTLKKGTNIYNLKVDQDIIKFTRRVCLVTGNAKNIENRYRDCPRVDFTIARENLKVYSAGKTLGVFGQGFVTLKGEVKPELQGTFEDYPVEFREGLKRNFDWKESTDETDIPIKGDFSITAVANAFRALSKEELDETIPGARSVLDDEPPEEPVREAKVEDKKKKKWWNPFD